MRRLPNAARGSGSCCDYPNQMNTDCPIRKKVEGTHWRAFSSISNSTLRAVAKPVVWTLPHKRHLSQPTQSMIRDTLRKCCLNSSFKIYKAHISDEITRRWGCPRTFAFAPRKSTRSSNLPTCFAMSITFSSLVSVRTSSSKSAGCG